MKIALEAEFSFLIDRLTEIQGVEVILLPPPDQMKGTITVDGLLGSAVGSKHLEKIIDYCVGLKWIHILGTGVNTFPLNLIKGQIVTCSRGATATPISEWVLGMMLAYEKQLPEMWISQPPDTWYMAKLGSLEGKTLGLIGFGSIGLAVAKKALAFDMKVIAKVRNYRDSPLPNVEFKKDIRTIFSQSDHIVLALPSTPQSQHIINSDTIKYMKPSTHLVNVSRADLIDQDALRAALDLAHIGRASLDIVTPEPLPMGHWMFSHPKVFLSAYISWCSPSSNERVITPFIENVRAYIKGQSLTGVVDTKAGY